MAKNILITPTPGGGTYPSIDFQGATTGTIKLEVRDDGSLLVGGATETDILSLYDETANPVRVPSISLEDTNATHHLKIVAGSNLTANRTFTLTTGDAARTLDISAADVTISSFGASIIDDADAAAVRTTLGLVIGTDVQGYDADLATWATLTPSAFFQTLVDDADAAASRTTLGLGTSATVNTGTSGTTIPLLDGTNTWTNTQTLSANLTIGASTASWIGGNSSNAVVIDPSFGVAFRTTASVDILIDSNNDDTTRTFRVRTNTSTLGSGGTILFHVAEDGTIQASGNTMWHAGNDGSGSGLDADTLRATTPTSFGLSLIDDADNTAARTTLGLGTSATVNTGTSGATIPLLNGNNTFSGTGTWDATGSGTIVTYQRTDDGATGPIVDFIHVSASPANNDAVLQIRALGKDNAANTTVYGRIRNLIVDTTDGSEDAQWIISAMVAGTDTALLTMAASSITFQGNTVWHAGNDGTGSGLDADLLDGNNIGTSGAAVPLLNGTNTWSGAQTITTTGTGTILTLTSTDAGATAGPSLTLYRNSASPAASDDLSDIVWQGKDSGANDTVYGRIRMTITDPTDASEDGIFDFLTSVAGTVATRARIGGGLYHSSATGGDKGNNTLNFGTIYQNNVQVLDTGSTGTSGTKLPYLDGANTWSAAQTISLSAAGDALTLISTDAGATSGPGISLYRNSASPAASDVIGSLTFNGKDSGGNITNYGDIIGIINDPTNGSEDGVLLLRSVIAGTLASRVWVGAGIYSEGVTGTDKGAGTANFTTIYQNNVALASAAFVATGTSGATIPLLNGANTWSADQLFQTTGTNTIVTATGGSGYGSFYAKGSGTNNAYLFLGNGTNNERARVYADNSRNFVISIDGGTTSHYLVAGSTGNSVITGGANGGLTVSSTSGYATISVTGISTNSAYFLLNNGTGERARIYTDNSRNLDFSTDSGVTTHFRITSAGVLQANGNTIWHAGNDGSGSGLDADLLDGLNSTAVGAGKQGIWIPAAAMWPRTTSGSAAIAQLETATNRINIPYLAFDTTTTEYAQFNLHANKQFSTTTVTFQAVWTHPSTTTNFGVAWELAALGRSDGDAGDTAVGTAVTVTDTGGTTSTIYVTSESSAMTIGGTFAAQDWVTFQVNREPSNGSDTMAVDAYLIGVMIYVTTTANTDV